MCSWLPPCVRGGRKVATSGQPRKRGVRSVRGDVAGREASPLREGAAASPIRCGLPQSGLSSHTIKMAEQANQVDDASGREGDDQHPVHRGLQDSARGSQRESPAKHERDRVQSLKVCFFRDSSLVYERRCDSRGAFPGSRHCEKPSGPRSQHTFADLRANRKASAQRPRS